MDFLLPSIYKPFYINVLLTRRLSDDHAFVIIDVYNGIGLYDKQNDVYDVGTIKITFTDNNNMPIKEKSLKIYRDKYKPLFNTSYKESITTVFTDFSIGGGRSYKLIVEYESPNNEYGVQINRNIRLEVDLQNNDGGISEEPFYLYQGPTGVQYNIWYDNVYGIDTNLDKRVSEKSNDFLYYVVNEGFYKYFIQPEHLNRSDGDIYQSYNNNEVNALISEVQRINFDLNPNSANYNDGDGAEYLPTESSYNKNKGNYCITTPFFRMYPSINSVPKKKQAPFAVRLVVVSGSTIVLERNIDGYELSEEKLEYNNFYLIGVKSPLTSLNETDYNNEYVNGGLLRPEQDYITVIEFISRIKVLKEDESRNLVPQEDYKDEYGNLEIQEDYEDE